MKCVAILLFMVVNLATAIKAGKTSNLQMAIPKYVSKNHDIHGKCTFDGMYWPKIRIDKNSDSECNFTIEEKRRIVKQGGANRLFCTDFVVRNVTATCQYQCAFSTTVVTKTVVVKDAKILQTPFNVTAFEGMPVKLNCTIIMTNVLSEYYKLIWINGDAFVSGNGYSIESTQFDRNTNTQSHYLTIHEASPGAYTCMLISATRKVIDLKTQYVVTESNSMASAILKELAQFFKWN